MSDKPKRSRVVKPAAKLAQALPARPDAAPLLSELRGLILVARQQVAQTVNAGLTMLYWQLGTRIRKDILKEKRAEYGQEILQSLSAKLAAEFGRGYSARNLANMVRFAEVFPDKKILQSLTAKLGWTHFQHLIYLDNPLKRDFFAEMCRLENWDTRTLAKKIQSMLFERTALSKKPEKLIREELDMSPAIGKTCCPRPFLSRSCTMPCAGHVPGSNPGRADHGT